MRPITRLLKSGSMNRLPILLLTIAFTITSTAQQPTGPPSAQALQELKKDPAEYNAIKKALAQTDLHLKIDGLREYLRQYPNSPVKEQALEELLMAYWFQVKPPHSDPATQKVLFQMMLTANSLLYVDPDNLRALALMVDEKETVAKETQSEEQAAQLHSDAIDLAKRGLRVLAHAQKPTNMSDAAYTQYITKARSIFNAALNDSSAQAK